MSTKVRIDMVPGYRQILNAEPGVKLVLRARAEAAAQIAKGIAPVQTGKYRDSIGVEQDLTGISLVATDFKANWIEKGTIHMRAFAPLRTAARKVASRVIEH